MRGKIRLHTHVRFQLVHRQLQRKEDDDKYNNYESSIIHLIALAITAVTVTVTVTVTMRL